MGRKCCVTRCRGNYTKKLKVKTFRLPRDDAEKRLWLSAIPRDNIPDHKDTVVCENHWPTGYETVVVFSKIRPKNPPSVFENIPKSMLPSPIFKRSTKNTSFESRSTVPDELQSFLAQDKIESFAAFKSDINAHKFFHNQKPIKCITFEVEEDSVHIQSIDFMDKTGIPIFLLKLHSNFKYTAYHCGVECKISSLSANRVCILNK